MTSRRSFLAVSAAGIASANLAVAAPAFAQFLGGKPVRLVVGFPAGGTVDAVARLVAERLRERYASTVIVENKPGAAGRIAVEAVKNGPADGSVILITPNPMITLYPHVYRKLSYDPLRDLVAVTTLSGFPAALSVGPAVPVGIKTLSDLVDWLRTNPKARTYGSSAAGSTLHFIGLVFGRNAGIDLTHVSYKGGGVAAIQDTLGGHLPFVITSAPVIIPHVRAGKLRALATTGTERSLALPDVPTFKESGYTGLEMRDWFGMFLPSGTSREIVDRLSFDVREVLKSKEVRDGLAKLSIEPEGATPAETERLVRAEYRMWIPIVQASGFVAEE